MVNQWQELHQLIHSLTPSEKGYFRKYASGYSDRAGSVYINLFRLLEDMDKPEIAIITKKLGSITKNIQSTRNYLYELILKSLGTYHRNSNVGFELREILDHIEILGKKGLRNQALKMVNKGIRKSSEEKMAAYNIIFQTHHKQLLNHYDESEKTHVAKQIGEQIKSNAEVILFRQIITDGHSRAVHLINSNFPLKDRDVKKEVESLLDTLLQINHTGALDNFSKNLLFAAISLLYRLLGDLDNAIRFQEKTIEIMEEIDLRKINRVTAYIAALFNLGNLYVFNGQFSMAEVVNRKLNQISIEGHRERSMVDALSIQTELDRIIFSRNFKSIQKIIAGAEEFLKNEHPVPNIYYDSQMRLLAYYIYTNNMEKALEKSFILMSTNYKHSQPSFHLHVRLLNLIVHYKLKNNLLLPSLVQSAYRNFRKERPGFKTEAIILSFFRSTLHIHDKKELQKKTDPIIAKLKIRLKDKEEASAMRMYFDYTWWLEHEAIAP
ncbi:MAG: hypothetical protein ACHQFW_03500 [Chitinophagales bacterium]